MGYLCLHPTYIIVLCRTWICLWLYFKMIIFEYVYDNICAICIFAKTIFLLSTMPNFALCGKQQYFEIFFPFPYFLELISIPDFLLHVPKNVVLQFLCSQLLCSFAYLVWIGVFWYSPGSLANFGSYGCSPIHHHQILCEPQT